MRLRRYTFIIWMIVTVFLFSIGVTTSYGLFSRRNILMKPTEPIEAEEKTTDNEKTGGSQVNLPAQEKPVNIIVLGLDEDGTRSDVIMVFNVDPAEGKINILSIPRDTLVKINSRNGKINEAYGVGKEAAVSRVIEKMTGLPIHYYVTVSFTGFRKVIDTLGGVEFTVPFNMNYDDPDQNLHIHLKKGTQVLDGKKAEQLIRYRKGNTAGSGYSDGDIGRIKMQQQFMAALINQKLKLRYISKMDELYSITKKYVKTNIEFSDLNRYLPALRRMDSAGINLHNLPGEPEYLHDIWYFVYNKTQTEALIQKDFYH